jgi:hypothetical protein
MTPTPFGNHPLQILSTCPLCEARTSSLTARVLAEAGATKLVHVTCRKCGGATLSLLLESEVGASSVGMVTDLSHEDVLRFQSASRVSTNDVIDVHAALGHGVSELFQVSGGKRRARSKPLVRTRAKARGRS